MSGWKPRHLRAGVVALVILALCMQCALADEETPDEAEEKIKEGGQTNRVLASINTFIEGIRPVILSAPMAIASVLALAQWHIIPLIPCLVGVVPSKFCRQLGLQVLVFQIYYADHFSCFKDKSFVTSITLIFFDTVIIYYTCTRYLKPLVHGPREFAKRYIDRELKAENHFMDIARHLRRSCICFLAQTGLVFYYVFELNSDPDTHDLDNVSVLEWIFAVIIMQIAVDDEMGAAFDQEFWTSLQQAITPEVKGLWEFRLWVFPMTLEDELKLRQRMDMIINGFCRTMIIGTAPIMLAVEGHLDFVKDCTALFFILTLDDMPSPRILTTILQDKEEYVDMQRSLGEGRSPFALIARIKEWLHAKDGDVIGEKYVHAMIEDLAKWPEISEQQQKQSLPMTSWRSNLA